MPYNPATVNQNADRRAGTTIRVTVLLAHAVQCTALRARLGCTQSGGSNMPQDTCTCGHDACVVKAKDCQRLAASTVMQ